MRIRTLGRAGLAAAFAASMVVGSGPSVYAAATANDHNCEGVTSSNWCGYPGLFAERAHQALQDGKLPAEVLGLNWAGNTDDNQLVNANCGMNAGQSE